MVKPSNVKQVPEINPTMEDFIATMAALGTAEGSGIGKRLEAITTFASTIKGGKSNFMPVDINDSAWRSIVDTNATRANNAYCDAQNAAALLAGETAVGASSIKTYLGYFANAGYVAVKAPDLVDPILAAVTKYCVTNPDKAKRPGKRTKIAVYHRTVTAIRDEIFGVDTGKNKTAARVVLPDEITEAYVAGVLGEAKTRTPRKDTPDKGAAPAAPAAAAPAAPAAPAATATPELLKSSAIECAKRLTATPDATMDPMIRMALSVIAAWS